VAAHTETGEESCGGRPSGIEVSSAELRAYDDQDTWIVLIGEVVRNRVEIEFGRKREKEERAGMANARGGGNR
jgi:hypothetical protein